MKTPTVIAKARVLSTGGMATDGQQFIPSSIPATDYSSMASAVADFTMLKSRWANPPPPPGMKRVLLRIALFIGDRLFDHFDTLEDEFFGHYNLPREPVPDSDRIVFPVILAVRDRPDNTPQNPVHGNSQDGIWAQMLEYAAYFPDRHVWAAVPPSLSRPWGVFATTVRSGLTAAVQHGFSCWEVIPREGVARHHGYVDPDTGTVAVLLSQYVACAPPQLRAHCMLKYSEIDPSTGFGWDSVVKVIPDAHGYTVHTPTQLLFYGPTEVVFLSPDDAAQFGVGPRVRQAPPPPPPPPPIRVILEGLGPGGTK